IFSLILCISVIFSGCAEQIGLGSDKLSIKIENGEATVREIPNKSTIKEVTVPDEYEGVPVTKIADFAAVNIESIEVINIGKNVKEIGTWAFENNQNLKAFKVSKDNPYFCDVDGVLFTKDMKTLLFYPLAKGVQVKEETNDKGEKEEVKFIEYAIPEGVETIRTKAFYKCQYLTKITIPQSVKVIEEKAFFRCGSIKELALPSSLEVIGKDAFSYCTSLTEIVIPASIKRIETYAFYNCTNLLKVDVQAKESDVTLGEKWYPTDNGKSISKLEINWA
ncbi:MAG: leucine-rich repeat domain-containing protein, partial [Candidatus Fimenecus sp.]